MSGILGIWNFDGRPVDPSELGKLSESLAHRGPDGNGLYIRGEFGLACRLSRIMPESAVEVQPLVDPSGIAVVFDGRLDNRDELIEAICKIEPLSRAAPDPALVLGAYHLHGADFAAHLAGDFTAAIVDPDRRQLLLARDAIGLRPLYYYRTPDLFLFASEIKTLLAHPKVVTGPADDVLADYIFNYLVTADDRGVTFFKNIFSVLPAHLAIVSGNNVVTRRYWDFTPASSAHRPSLADCVDGFRHFFTQSVRRRLRSATPVAVSVSGGLDSSAIFCVGETLRRDDPTRYPALLGASYSADDGSPVDEERFLREIENHYGVSIERFDHLRTGIMHRSREAIWHIEAPMLDVQWSAHSTFLEEIRARGTRVLLTGHWGDQFLFDDAYVVELCRRGAWLTAWQHVHEYGGWLGVADQNFYRRRLLRGLWRNALPDAVVPALRRLRRRLRQAPNPQSWYAEPFRQRAESRTAARGPGGFTAHGRSLYQMARSRYHVLCMEWNNKVGLMHGLDMAFPFLDRDLIAFLMSIPGELQAWSGIPKVILREALRGVLPDAIAQRRGKADFTDAGNSGMADDFDDISACLRAGSTTRMGYVKPDRIAGQIAEMRSRVMGDTCDVSRPLADLLALELWLQVFMAPAPQESPQPPG